MQRDWPQSLLYIRGNAEGRQVTKGRMCRRRQKQLLPGHDCGYSWPRLRYRSIKGGCYSAGVSVVRFHANV